MNATMPLTTRWLAAVLAMFFALTMISCAQNTSLGQKVEDTTITTKVKAALLADPDVPGTAISVETLRGQVQLSGFVKSAVQAQRAVDLTQRVDGVRQVINKMTVRSG